MGTKSPGTSQRCRLILQHCLAIQLSKPGHTPEDFWMYDSGYMIFQVIFFSRLFLISIFVKVCFFCCWFRFVENKIFGCLLLPKTFCNKVNNMPTPPTINEWKKIEKKNTIVSDMVIGGNFSYKTYGFVLFSHMFLSCKPNIFSIVFSTINYPYNFLVIFISRNTHL